MGHSIGLRLIEDLLAKASLNTCTSFKETAEVIAKVGFKVFLNVVPVVVWPSGGAAGEGRQCGMLFEENPLAEFVELPDDGRAQRELWYSNLYCGIIRGALEMVCIPVIW